MPWWISTSFWLTLAAGSSGGSSGGGGGGGGGGGPMLLGASIGDILAVMLRTVILYTAAFLIFRVMGKRSVGHLAPFDLAVLIIIGETAALPMEDPKTPIIRGLVPLVLLGLLHIGVSWVTMKSRPVEAVLQGVPTLLVKDGKIIMKNLRKEHITIPDLEISMRLKGISKLSDVAEARLEPTGGISFIKTSQAASLTQKDLQKSTANTLDILLAQNRERLRTEYQRLLDLRRQRQ